MISSLLLNTVLGKACLYRDQDGPEVAGFPAYLCGWYRSSNSRVLPLKITTHYTNFRSIFEAFCMSFLLFFLMSGNTLRRQRLLDFLLLTNI